MPEANVLYTITAVVISGLVLWVVFVLRTSKEQWARPRVVALQAEGPESADTAEAAKVEEKAEPEDQDNVETKDDTTVEEKKSDADDTARATPVAIAEKKSEGRAKAAAVTAPDEGDESDESDGAKSETKSEA